VPVAAGSAADDISLASWLEHEGFKVMTAIDEQEALQIAGSSWQPDIVLLDRRPPEVEVFRVCERVRAKHRKAVIFVLGGDPQEDEVRSLDSGADATWQSPAPRRCCWPASESTCAAAWATGRRRIMEFGDLRLDTKNHATWVKGEWVDLRPQELRLLVAVAQ
jgi:DNA-binding response OmpR family regulator